MTGRNKHGPSRLEYCHDQLKRLIKTSTDIDLRPSECNFPIIYVASYNELEQLRIHCHLIVFVIVFKF